MRISDINSRNSSDSKCVSFYIFGNKQKKAPFQTVQGHNPAGTWRRNNVVSTSMWRHDVTSTLVQRCFDAMCLLGLSRSVKKALGQSDWDYILAVSRSTRFRHIAVICVPAMNPLFQGRVYQIVTEINWNLGWGISGVLSRYLWFPTMKCNFACKKVSSALKQN